jgi:hypothetical protein
MNEYFLAVAFPLIFVSIIFAIHEGNKQHRLKIQSAIDQSYSRERRLEVIFNSDKFSFKSDIAIAMGNNDTKVIKDIQSSESKPL